MAVEREKLFLNRYLINKWENIYVPFYEGKRSKKVTKINREDHKNGCRITVSYYQRIIYWETLEVI